MTYMMKEIMEQPETLQNCITYNEEKLNTIVEELKKTKIRYVVIAARGTSDNAGVYGKYAFEMLTGLPVVLAAPSVVTMYKCNLKFEDSLVIGISQSGEAKDVIEVLDNANRCGAVTVSITNNLKSPLALCAKHCLFCNTGEEKSVAATKTFTAQLLLLGSLAAKLSGNSEAQAQLRSVPQYVRKAVDLMNDDIENAVTRYRFIDECIVLARGINYSVALESALKIEESSYVRAKAFASSDFHHGPMAILQKDMPVIIYAPAGPSLSDERDMIAMVKDAGADILVISDNAEVCADADCKIMVPETGSELVSPFVNAVAAQLFACRLSQLKGLNPDNPRMLHKITVTV